MISIEPWTKRPTRIVGVEGPSQEWTENNTYWFGGERVPNRLAEFNCLLSGNLGSGKTTALLAMQVSRFQAKINNNEPFIGWVFSSKHDDFVHVLRSIFEPQGIRVVTTNPFVESSFIWDGANDLTIPPAIDNLSTIIVKDTGNEQNPFFKKCSQLLIRGVIQSLATTDRTRWRLRHVVAILSDIDLTRAVLARCPQTAHLVALLSEDQEVTLANLKSTILAELKALEIIASLIDDVPDSRRFSIKQAARTPGVIFVYSSDARFASVLAPFNAIQFDLFANEFLTRGKTGVEVLMFIDEFPQLNNGLRLNSILRLLEYGRSNEVRIVLACQTPAQVLSVYGDKDGETLLGQLQSFMAFRHSDSFGAAFISKRFSREKGFERIHSYSGNSGWSKANGKWSYSGGNSHSINLNRYDLDRVPEELISSLPVGTYEDGLFGVCSIPMSRRKDPRTGFPQPIRWKFHLTPEWIAENVPTPGPFIPYNETLKPESAYMNIGLKDWEYDLLRLPRPSEDQVH